MLHGEFGFVRLEVANQFPVERGILAGGLRAFFDALLHAVFADAAEAVARRVVGGGGGMRFGNREQLHFGGLATGAFASGGDLRANRIGAAGELFVGDQHAVGGGFRKSN